jgi:hypothetical protein
VDIHEIAANYKSFPTYRLTNLADNPEGLPLELIPVLQKELLARGEHEDALKLSQYLIDSQKQDQKLTREELQEEVRHRLAAGEPIESIALKFKENGIDVFKELEADDQVQENTFSYILSLKEKGVAEEEINEKLQTNFSLSEEEVDIVKQKLKTKGRLNLVVGYFFTVVILILFIVGARISFGGMILLGIGIWRIVEGHSILNKMDT